jgi:pimeloyl-ACP methyl ester carboxylesterase
MFTRSPHIYLIASLRVVAALAPGIPLPTAAAQNQLVPAQEAASLLGVEHAQGAVIWSHGRSLQKECSLVPTPDYIAAFRVAGWDTFRLNRPSVTDTLPDSASALASEAEALKRQGYRRVVLAGQSFGGFI